MKALYRYCILLILFLLLKNVGLFAWDDPKTAEVINRVNGNETTEDIFEGLD